MVRRFAHFAAALMLALGALVLAAAAPATAGVQIQVNLNAQTMRVTTPDGEVRNWAISSAAPASRRSAATIVPMR